jgi:Tol biopolymer transport system component
VALLLEEQREGDLREREVFALRGFAAVLLVLVLLLVDACAGGEEAPPPTATPIATPGETLTPAPSPSTPEASLPLGRIAFDSRRDGNGEVYLLSPAGEQNLSNNPAEDLNPDLSPDGSMVAFASDREGTFHIYVMNIDGSGLTKLTDEAVGDLFPKWSPDGRRIAFVRTGSLWVIDSDGTNVQQVTKPKLGSAAPPCEGSASLGDWSPDGQQLTFHTTDPIRTIGQVCTINLDGSGLTVVASEPPGYHTEPAWSPDGEWIAYRFIEDNNHEIYIVRPDGASRINLTNDPATDIEPAWSPDGKWLVFVSHRHDDSELYIMKGDGSDVARITTSPGKDSEPSWGP